ncbi:MAG: VOC family protein [Bacteroidota bacterium]
MELGVFSISLSVKDLAASQAFYEKLGFSVFGGDASQHYLILKNGKTLIGLFQGMFEGNILTFNPGWDENASPLEQFADVRQIEAHLVDQGLALDRKTEAGSSGPGSIALTDPDGNHILIDQHV